MKVLLKSIKSLTKFELTLWISSSIIIIFSFLISKNKDYLSLFASLIGATALILVSKGNVVGLVLTVLFSILYGMISFTFRYYGEMITYMGMTAPIAIVSIVTWLKNPYKGNQYQIKIGAINIKDFLLILFLSILVTIGFYFILKAFKTNSLILSVVSVFTSCLASLLSVKRSQYYAIAYALNDIVLIALWIIATLEQSNYLPMVLCFIVFLINDLYGFFNWSKLKKKQNH